MSISTQNLLRQVGSGYGSTGYDPYNIYAAMLGEASGDLATKKSNEAYDLQQQQFEEQKRQFDVSNTRLQQQLDEMVKESTLRDSLQLAQSGFGTEQELNKLGSTYGLSYTPKVTTPETGLAGTTGSGAGTAPDISKLLAAYRGIAPYATRMPGSLVNIYDPTLAKLKEQLGNALTSYKY